MTFAVRLPTPDGRHAGHSPTPRCDRQPASFQADPVSCCIPACEDDAQPEGGMGRGLSGWLRFFAYPLIDSAGGTVDQIDGHVPQPTRTSCATSLFQLPRLAHGSAGDFVE